MQKSGIFDASDSAKSVAAPRGAFETSFKNLPLAVQEKLLRMQRGEPSDYLAYKVSSPFFRWAFLVAAIIWFGVLIYLAAIGFLLGDVKR